MPKTILVTGCTSGIGSTLAMFYLDKGFNVIGLARNKNKLNKIKKDYNNFYGYQVDIGYQMQLINAFNDIREHFKNIDILVNNAGVFKKENFTSHSYKDFNNIIDTNLKGLIGCTWETLKFMKQPDTKYNIINICSVSGLGGIKDQSVYSASKHGVKGFSESLQQELNCKNIRVTTLYLGGVNTDLWNKNNPYDGYVNQLLSTFDVCSIINYIVNLPSHIVMKELVMFPSCEYH